MKKTIFIIALPLILGLYFFVPDAIAQLKLYQVNQSLLYPDIYAIQDIKTVPTFDAMKKSILAKDNLIHGYLIGRDSKNFQNYHLSTPPTIMYKKNNNSQYLISLNNLHGDIILVFNQRYNNAWALKNTKKEPRCIDQKMQFSRFSVTECKTSSEKYNIFYNINSLFIPVYPKADHFLINGFSNAWYIHVPPNQSKLTLSLEFQVQNYFSLGLIISIVTFILCIGYLIKTRL